jgi:hypothetical protein
MTEKPVITTVTVDRILYSLYYPFIPLTSRDDTVYVANENPNEAHYLGRIIEFTPPLPGLPGKDTETSFKYAWFYRAADVPTRRRKIEPRLVIASMNTETSMVSALRGKCSIKHATKVAKQMKTYLAQPDSFYYGDLANHLTNRSITR